MISQQEATFKNSGEAEAARNGMKIRKVSILIQPHHAVYIFLKEINRWMHAIVTVTILKSKGNILTTACNTSWEAEPMIDAAIHASHGRIYPRRNMFVHASMCTWNICNCVCLHRVCKQNLRICTWNMIHVYMRARWILRQPDLSYFI